MEQHVYLLHSISSPGSDIRSAFNGLLSLNKCCNKDEETPSNIEILKSSV